MTASGGRTGRAGQPASSRPRGTDEILFSEPGARWWPVALGPALAVVGVSADAAWGSGLPVLMWVVSAVILAAVGALVVYAARTHTCVELTAETLRLGTDEVAVAEIVHVFPAPPAGRTKKDPREPWESARSLGGLSVVPRGRRGIGVRMRTGVLRQAWARDAAGLRERLEPLVASSRGAARRGAARGGSARNNGVRNNRERNNGVRRNAARKNASGRNISGGYGAGGAGSGPAQEGTRS